MSGTEKRTRGRLGSPGPFLAEVTNLLDPTYMGGIEVALIKGTPVPIDLQSRTFIVKHLSPFYGVTSIRYEGNNSSDFNDVQKSYGMWMVPPDVGTQVLVIFVDGDPNQGFWIGCVADEFQNHMVPGLAASKQTLLTPEQERRYGTSYLPVAEFHKATQQLDLCRNPHYMAKPVHPFADRLLAQGLLLDTVRGVTSSSARREVPSQVFGISTPGPLDDSPGAKRGKVGYTGNKQEPVSRLGGSTFVMDDGDKNGQNELVRIRTRTGHQILLHNTHDLIYIANSKGTAWIELTSNGKIDIYAEDSVSIHTETDFNFRADRDVNIEAGRNFNLNVGNTANINVSQDYNLIVDQTGKLSFGSYNNSSKEDLKFTAGTDLNIKAGGSVNQTASSDINLLSNGNNNFTTNGNTNISSAGNHLESAAEIHMNGPTAATAASATAAETASKLPLFTLPNKSKDSGWSNGNFYAADSINSIMQRVPTHEPWPQHENIDPVAFSRDATDAYAGSAGGDFSANKSTPPLNPNQPADWTKDTEFVDKVKTTASALGCSPEDLLACMAFETGRTFNPSLRNGIGATGLIQFIPSTARSLGTTTDYLAGLTRTQQMEWVQKYFKAGPLSRVSKPSIDDLYMSILWPAAVGQPDNYVLFSAGTKAYAQNPLDKDGKGYVTKADAAAKARAQLAYVKQKLAEIEAAKP